MGGHVRWAVGLDDERFLVHSKRAEILSARPRRPTGPIALPLPSHPLAQGHSQQRVWFLDDAGGIAVFRLSDGTRTSARLPAPGLRAVGHPESGWLLVDLGATWQAINLVTGVSEGVPASVLAPCAVLPLRSAALLMQPSLDGLDVWEIGGAPELTPGLHVRVEPPGRR